MKVAVVTASIGERRPRLRTPLSVRRGVDFICFTDNPELKSDVWKIIHRTRILDDPCRDAKRFKVLIHEHVDADASIWIDRHCRLKVDALGVFDEFTEDLSLVRHYRRCIYHEARACMDRGKDCHRLIKRSISEYRAGGHPPRWGLFWGGIIFRRHNDRTREFADRWWNLIQNGSRRDQLSLPVAIRKTKGLTLHQRGRECLEVFGKE